MSIRLVVVDGQPLARFGLARLVHAAYATPVSLMIPILGIYAGLGLSGRQQQSQGDPRRRCMTEWRRSRSVAIRPPAA